MAFGNWDDFTKALVFQWNWYFLYSTVQLTGCYNIKCTSRANTATTKWYYIHKCVCLFEWRAWTLWIQPPFLWFIHKPQFSARLIWSERKKDWWWCFSLSVDSSRHWYKSVWTHVCVWNFLLSLFSLIKFKWLFTRDQVHYLDAIKRCLL